MDCGQRQAVKIGPMNLPKRPKHSATERDGVNYVRAVVEGANCIFHEIHRENDYGNDAFIELVDGEQVTGICIALQIKSGKSYCETDRCRIRSTPEQRDYWSGHKLPVVGVAYDPGERVGYWVDITRRLASRSGDLVFPKSDLSRFDPRGFRDFFLPMFLNKPILLGSEESMVFATSDSFEMHAIGVQSLFHGHRNDLTTWDFLERLLRERPSSMTTGYLAYIFAHVPGHGDIVWGKHSILDESIRSSLMDRMSRYDLDLIVPLIRLVDENGFGRGTVGQSVYAVLDLAVADSAAKLKAVLEDEALESETRRSALWLCCLIEQGNAEAVLTRLADTDKELSEAAAELLDHLNSAGFFYAG